MGLYMYSCYSASDLDCLRSVFLTHSLSSVPQMPVEERVGGVAFLSGAPIVVEQWAEKLQVSTALTHTRIVMCALWICV
eukprot:scaffold13172_cov44-Tisochrysis_lutea.AAC.2